MDSLVVLVLAQPGKLPEVLQAWQDSGVAEATVIESTGLGRVRQMFGRDDLPLFASLRALSEYGESAHNTVFSVVDNDALVDRLVAVTQSVVGDLSEPNRGILFVVPLARVIGYRLPQKAKRNGEQT